METTIQITLILLFAGACVFVTARRVAFTEYLTRKRPGLKYGNNPIQDVVDTCNQLYPGKNCELIFADGIKEKDDAWAATVWPDDGSAPQVWIDARAPYSAVIELIAHEFAHVVAGAGAGHGVEWEIIFDQINREFNGEVS